MNDIVKITQALSDPIRYNIILLLVKNQHNPLQSCCQSDYEGICNCEIMAKFNLIQSRVSYHMKQLIAAGLVTEEPRGKWKYYSLNPQTLKDYIKQLEVDFEL